METRIGISGWTYAGWRGVFYPEDLPHRRELEFASRRLNSIEINGTFYSMQKPPSFRRWWEETPPDFVFAVKGSRFITHMKKLNDVEAAVSNFFAQGLLRLGEKLGPILWQFPERMRYDPEKFEAFLDRLPHTHGEAAELARGHDHRLEGRAWTEPATDRDRPIRHAFEPRNPRFFGDEFARQLRRHGAALVFADTAGHWPYAEEVTADFVYLRLHGDEELYVSGYTEEALDWWADRIRLWRAGRQPADARRLTSEPPPTRRGRDVFVYFDNDAKVKAPFDALRLAERLGGGGRRMAAD